MDGTTVIVGAGRVGFRTAELFAARGREVTLIERDAEKCEQVLKRSGGKLNMVAGDGTSPPVLEQVISGDTTAFGALTADGETNMQALMLARELAPGARFAARVRTEPEGYHEYFDDLRLVTASSVAASANALGADVSTAVREHVGGMEVLELVVSEDATVVGRSLADAGLPRGCLVVTVDGEHRADGDTTLEPGESVTVAVERDAIDETRSAFGTEAD